MIDLMQIRESKRVLWVLLMLSACNVAVGVPRAEAQNSQVYRIGGELAPKLQINPMASQLQEQLLRLKQDLEARTKRTTLEQAIETALLNNPDLAVAYAQIQNSQWNLIAVRRQWYPTLTAASNAIPDAIFAETRARGSGSTNTTSYITSSRIRANLSWTFFDPSRGPAINATSESLRRQQLLFDVTARNLVLSVQENYFFVQEYQELINAYEEIQARIDSQVVLTEAQFNSGIVTIADVEQIRTQQYSNISELIITYNKLLESAAQLAETMALPPGFIALSAGQFRTTGNWKESLPETITQALQLREEIQASLAAADSSNWAAISLFNTYWPRFNIGASGNVAYIDRTNGSSGLASNTSTLLERDGAVGLGFTWQLFDGGIRAANAQASKAQATQFLQQAASNRLNVAREVEQAYSAYLTSQLALLSTNAQAQSARKAVTAVQARFDIGITDMASVVQALIQAIRAANVYASASRNYNSAVARLYRFSARWPEGTQLPLQQRTDMLRQK